MSIFPTALDGGVVIRSADGACTPSALVSNSYCPDPEFTMTCDATFLPNDCTARITPAQINNITSELLCLAETMAPDGLWNCGSVCNLGGAFTRYMTSTALVSLFNQIQSHLCAMPNITRIDALTTIDPRLILCNGDGNLYKVPYNELVNVASPITGAGTPGSPFTVQNATVAQRGVVELATELEANAGAADRVVTSATLHLRTPCGAPDATGLEIDALTAATTFLTTCVGGVVKRLTVEDVLAMGLSDDNQNVIEGNNGVIITGPNGPNNDFTVGARISPRVGNQVAIRNVGGEEGLFVAPHEYLVGSDQQVEIFDVKTMPAGPNQFGMIKSFNITNPSIFRSMRVRLDRQVLGVLDKSTGPDVAVAYAHNIDGGVGVLNLNLIDFGLVNAANPPASSSARASTSETRHFTSVLIPPGGTITIRHQVGVRVLPWSQANAIANSGIVTAQAISIIYWEGRTL